jgi:signal transduction histidine kinase
VGTPVADLAAEVADAREASAEADLEYMFVQIPKAAERALDGVHRVGTIVRSMNVFAHPDKVDMAPVDLNQAITSTLTIARNEYRYVANVDTELGQLPPVTCYAGEINQVILNILINSAHAIGEIHAQTGTRGKITVKTAVDVAHVLISIRDTGGGIPDEVGGRIFDPFFTTKGVGKGTGQGLSIARSVIIDRHHGEITFQSTPGVGTTFNIRIPIDPVQPARKAAA